jgi:hypothetical protein
MSLVLFDVFRRVSGRVGASLAVMVFLSLFAFAHLTEAGLFNFTMPYSHAATVGVGLCVLLVWLLLQVRRRPRPDLSFAAGFVAGLAWLTKPEIAVAALLTMVTGFLLLRGSPRRPGNGLYLAAVAGLILPSAIAVLAFWGPLGAAALSVPWLSFESAASAKAWDLPFYRAVSGLSRPWHNLAVTVGSAAAFVLVLFLVNSLERHLPEKARQWAGLGVLVACAAAMIFFMDSIPWLEAARPLPVLTAVVFILVIRPGGNSSRPVAASEARFGLACWSVLSLVLLAKIALKVRFDHFGFYLALPATLLISVVLVVLLPRWLPASSRRYVKALAILIIGALSANGLGITLRQYAARSFELGPANDRMFVFQPQVDPRGVTISRTLEFLDRISGQFETLFVAPEGATLNFWLRRSTSTRHLSLMPPEVARYGDSRVLEELAGSRPDIVLMTTRDLQDYSVPEFAATPLGTSLTRWLESEYCPLFETHARAADYQAAAREQPVSVVHPTHQIVVYGKKGSEVCS